MENEEVEEFSKVASALLVNVGTVTAATFEPMTMAAKAYSQAKKPWVLDPVAAGATKYRMLVRPAATNTGAQRATPSLCKRNGMYAPLACATLSCGTIAGVSCQLRCRK